jgi:cyclohexyl-isocyanide hydratase
MISEDRHLRIGALIFPDMDQIDLTGPFEVLSRLPNSSFSLFWKDTKPIRDMKGLALTPDCSFAEAEALDVLVVPGGFGQEALMGDEEVLGFLREQAKTAAYVFSVCTGALLCGAAGLLENVQSTTHWMSFHLLEYFGAVPMRARVVFDGKHVSAAGVTAGIDGALRLAALLRGDEVAQEIQLTIEYAPDPPFRSGTPETAPPAVRAVVEERFRPIVERRLASAQRYRRRPQDPGSEAG